MSSETTKLSDAEKALIQAAVDGDAEQHACLVGR
jgi:hypothetical protein